MKEFIKKISTENNTENTKHYRIQSSVSNINKK